jgi:integrase
MPVTRRKDTRRWVYRTVVTLPNGTCERIFGTPAINTKQAALDAERAHIERMLKPPRKEVPTFAEWFWGAEPESAEPNGRFWIEWVIGRKNKPGEQSEKKCIYQIHLRPAFGHLGLDEIGVGHIAAFRASLIQRDARPCGKPKAKKRSTGRKLSDKRINNILGVLSKSLRYAADVEVIDHAPKIGLLRHERPEIVCWELDQYARVLEAARKAGPEWYAAACLAGEAGLRVGEVKALRWREDVDLVAGTLTVNQQVRHGVVGTPKGRSRRTVPMTPRLLGALKALQVVRTGFVVRNPDGSQLSDSQARDAMYRICRLAGLPERGWHVLRHSFGTHAAMLGVNPWRLQTWMGHKRIDETMLYVNFAGAHMRPIPPTVLLAAGTEVDPDQRILKMLGARGTVVAQPTVVKREAEEVQIVN